jgi:putative copper export protein
VLGLRLAAALALWAILGALRQSSWLRWTVPTLGLAMAFVDATASHATPVLPQPLGALLSALHISAMGIWLGGLTAFAIAPAAGFSRVAAWSASLLVVSGGALALLHLTSPLDVITTAYGGALLIKLPLVAAALLLAWRARRRIELAVLCVVVAAAAVMVSLPPPR